MSGSEKQKNRNSSQMRNRALPGTNQQQASTQYTPSLDPIPGPARDRSAKGQNKQQSKVMLGMPDIPIDENYDNDAYATKIGGKPIWLKKNQHPQNAIQYCGCCKGPMYLVFQGYAPLENSIYHRTMYVWACNRRLCIKQPGSIKAIRAHQVDPEYLKQQKKKAAAKLRKEAQIKAAKKRNAFVGTANGSKFQLGDLWSSSNEPKISSGNPFAMQSAQSQPNPFQMPPIDNIEEDESEEEFDPSFSQQFTDKLTIQEEDEEEEEEEEEGEYGSNQDTNGDNQEQFVCQKAFPGHYLYICEEEAVESYDSIGLDMKKYQKYLDIQQAEEQMDDSEEGASWAGEAYEKQKVPRGFDKTFKKFTERVSAWPEQCVRYEFSGSPLLFSNSDEAAKSLIASSAEGYGVYSNSKLPPCQHCGGDRTFEFQLMPNVLTLLAVTDHAMKEEQTSDKTGMDQWNVGMEFGTVMVFVCEKDCNGPKDAVEDYGVKYFEEHVVAQFEL